MNSTVCGRETRRRTQSNNGMEYQVNSAIPSNNAVTGAKTATFRTLSTICSHKTGKWSKEEDDQLKKTVTAYGERQWRKIAEHIPGRTAIQCLHRWTKILKPGLVKGPWTNEEDEKLAEWVRREGPTKWAQAAHYIQGRSGKQCRERWYNNLNPNVKKGNWAEEEDQIIFRMYRQYGSSWSKIAKYLSGRTENSIKNRFYSTLRKIAADKKKEYEESDHPLLVEPEIIPVVEEVIVEQQVDPILDENNHFLYKLLTHETPKDPWKRSEDGQGEEIFMEDGNALSERITADTFRPEELPRKRAFTDLDMIEPQMFLGEIERFNTFMVKETPFPGQMAPEGRFTDVSSRFENFLDSVENALNVGHLTRDIDNIRHRVQEIQPVITEPSTPDYALLNRRKSNSCATHEMVSRMDLMRNASQSVNVDNKMLFLISKLQSLEDQLSTTRHELNRIESTIKEGAQTVSVKEKETTQNIDFDFFREEAEFGLGCMDESPYLGKGAHHEQKGQDTNLQTKLEENEHSGMRMNALCEDYFMNYQ